MVLEVTAKNDKGEEMYKDSRIYMPYPGRNCRGSEMGRGPYEKCGLIRETSLEPGKTVSETFEFTFPYHDVMKDGEFADRVVDEKELTVSTKLWYVPFGAFNGSEVLWFEDTRTMGPKGEWVWKK